MMKTLLKLLADFENCRLNQGQFGCLSCLFVNFFLLWPSSFQLLSLRFFDSFNVLFFPLVLVFGMSVSCSIREIAFATRTGEISAFRVFTFASAFALFLHILQEMIVI